MDAMFINERERERKKKRRGRCRQMRIDYTPLTLLFLIYLS